MRILYIVNYFPPLTGAAAINSQKITEHLVKLDNNLVVLAPGDMGKTFNIKIPNYKMRFSSFKVKYSSSIIKFPLSLVFSHVQNMLTFVRKISKTFYPDIILSQHHAFHYASVVGNYLSKKSDICYLTTNEMRNYYLKFKKLINVNFKIHPNGIDINEFYPYKNQEELKEEYGCETIISFIGLMSYDIGIQNLIRIFPEVLKSNKDINLILIGDGPYKGDLINLINKLNLNKKIHFLGVKPHNKIPYYINNSDIGIGRITHKKQWKYMIPVKCLEYMACKKSFITTPISQDIIKNNDVGLLLEKDFSDKALINNLNILIEDKKLRNQLGENGLKRIYEKFRWENLMKNFNDDLKEVIENKT